MSRYTQANPGLRVGRTVPVLVLFAGLLLLILIALLAIPKTPVLPVLNEARQALIEEAPAQTTQTNLSRVPVGLESKARQAWNNRPLYFEPNVGQFGPEVEFRVRSNSAYTLFATKTGLEFIFPSNYSFSTFPNFSNLSNYIPTRLEWSAAVAQAQVTTSLSMQTLAANSEVQIEGLEATGGKVNYLTNTDPASHHYDVPLYAALAYRSIYPGIDQLVYGTQNGELQYDFVVAPQADPGLIRLRFNGAEKVSLNSAGELVLKLNNGTFYQRSLLVYQEQPVGNPAGSVARQRQQIPARFKIWADESVSFELGDYDQTLPLIIDPILAYSTYYGREGDDVVFSSATDSAGNIYIAGISNSPNLTTTAGAYQSSINPQTGAAFVAKLNPNATGAAQLLYATYLGGTQSEAMGTGLKIDATGQIYLAGKAYSQMPVTANAYQSENRGDFDAFLAVLNPAATGAAQLVYCSYYGGSGLEDQIRLYLDNTSNNFYIAGYTVSTDLTTTTNAFQTTNRGETDGFVARLNFTNQASSLVYATYYGGTGSDRFNALTVDSNGNIYLAGSTTSTDLAISNDAYQATNISTDSGALVKLNPAATGTAQLGYATYLGNSGHTYLGAIALDSSGIVYLGGANVYGQITTTVGAYQTTHSGQDGIVLKLNLAAVGANQLIYATYLGGSADEQIEALATDSSGNIYVTGITTSGDFPVTANALQTAYKGGNVDGWDAFVAWLNPAISAPAAQLRFASYWGGTGDEVPKGIFLLANNKLAIAGQTRSADLPTSSGAFQPVFGGAANSVDGFVSVIAPPANIATVNLASSSNPAIYPTVITFTATVNPVTEENTVVFKKDATVLGVVPLINGTATYSVTNLAIGSYIISAVYSETATYARSGTGLTQTVSSGPPVIITATSGISQTAQPNTTFTRSFVVTAANVANYPAYGYVVTFTAPGNGASGVFTTNDSTVYTATTDTNGRVTAPVFKANAILGTYTVTATVAGVATPTLFYLYNGPVANRVYGQAGSFLNNNPNRNGLSENSLLSPVAAVQAADNSRLYIADAANNRVLRFDVPTDTTADAVYGQNGSFITNTANLGGISRASLSSPQALALDSEQNLYVVDRGNHRVLMFGDDGDMLADRVYGQAGDFTTGTANKNGISATSLNSPQGIVIDAADNLYIADSANNRVLYFPKGSTTATLVYGQNGDFGVGSINNGQATPGAATLNYPIGLVLDNQNNLYLADADNNRLLFFPSGSLTATRVYGQAGSFSSGTANNGGVSASSLRQPEGLALDSSAGLYVGDYLNHRVLYFSNDGDTIADRVYGQNGRFTTAIANNGGVSAATMRIPQGVFITSDGGLYICEVTNNRVLYYPNPNLLAVTSSTEDGAVTTPGRLSYALMAANSGMTITFALTQGNTITFTTSLTTNVRAGVSIDGGSGIVLNGNGVAGSGLKLLGSNKLLNLIIRRFAAQELVVTGTGNKLYRVIVEN